MKKLHLLTSLSFVFIFSCLSAQTGYVPSPENLKNREWFQDAKYGLFIHWGVYSLMAGGGDQGIAEWIMNSKRIPIRQYEKLPSFFNPVEFDADEWVEMVKKAGMKYITITSKHHDGFAMYDSKVSNYDIVERTPFGRDVLKELKQACDRQGIKLFFYHSQLDWHHPDYFPRGNTGQGYTGRPESGNWNNYIDYMNTQLTELLTNYGEIGGIWFDGMWDKPNADWRLDETYSLIHKLQPGALIGSNHHLYPFPGEDFQMFERDLPGQNTMGFNHTGPISDLPIEMCETMNGSWGFNIIDTKYKSTATLIKTMVRAAGYGANFLLNTGPMPNGKIQPENVDTLMVIGKWLEKYGESIYGTRKGPFEPAYWGASTQKGNTIYVHITDLKEEHVLLPDIPDRIAKIVFFDDDTSVQSQRSAMGLILKIPAEKRKDPDTIVKILIR
ncbi:MAG: alpha-L-fucosidase [Bacteroidales bacterium]|nr:alpha-L-fucosidase [Bacteroidales bacterium]